MKIYVYMNVHSKDKGMIKFLKKQFNFKDQAELSLFSVDIEIECISNVNHIIYSSVKQLNLHLNANKSEYQLDHNVANFG